jgi:hypothetical protein
MLTLTTECDKSFTRSDALAKHMRTVHEPEPARGSTFLDPTAMKKAQKLKLSNGAANAKSTPQDMSGVPTHDEDETPIEPSHPNDNITYIPAHHPITGQPGFMIHYPADIHFTTFESAVEADHLMRMLRRQIAWAESEANVLKRAVDDLEKQKREEWAMKEVLLEAVMAAELSRADQEGLLRSIDARVEEAMEKDTLPAQNLKWNGPNPLLRRRNGPRRNREVKSAVQTPGAAGDEDGGDDDEIGSPPPTGASGGFEGEGDPYDNYLEGMMAQYEKRQQAESTPMKTEDAADVEAAAEADAVGALMGLSGGR